mmetsp:Transcript_16693/g.22970  ORF Transcript_16693/g.22970 Transcript_16693/m.22970 type:complete len:195 (-) Transcript_16693:144-728(-)
MLEIREYIDQSGGLLNGEVVDVRKEYEMLAKLNLIDEKKVNELTLNSEDDGNLDEDNKFIRELSIANDSEKKLQYNESMDDIFDRFELFEREHNRREAAPKLELKNKKEPLAPVELKNKSSGWKSGFLNSSNKVRKDLIAQHTELASKSIPEHKREPEAAIVVESESSTIEEAVEVKKAEPKKAFTGNIVERFH